MKRFFTFAVAAALAVGLGNSAWSQGAGGGGGGGAGGGGASGAGGAGAGASGSASAGGAQSSAGTAGTATTGRPSTAGAAGATNRAGAAGTAGINSRTGTPGIGTGLETGNGNATGSGNVRFFPQGQTNAAARAGTRTGPNGQAAISDPVGMNGRANMNGISQTPFFTDPGVRQQLNLNNNQFNALNQAHQTALSRFNQALNNLNPNLTADQRALEMQRLENQFNTDFMTGVNSTLTDPQTRNRFNQLNRQFMAFNAFNNPQIRQQLNLTSDQLSRVRQLSNDFRQQLQQFRRAAGNNVNNIDITAFNNVQSQFAAQLSSILTPEQQQIWTQLIGQPFVFSPTVFGTGTPAGNVTVNGPSGSAVAPSVRPQGQSGTAADTNPVGATTGVTVEQSTTRGTNTNAANGTQPSTATTQGTTTQGTTGTVR